MGRRADRDGDDERVIMQIIVLGMHRSGTSAVVRLLNLMGAYLGPPGSIKGANPENPKGFWENEDLVELNKGVLAAQRCLWDRLGEFDRTRLGDERLATLRRRALDFLIDLDRSRPWAVKDPRMCLLMPFWRPMLEVPVCVVVNRNPVEVAGSLRARNGMPVPVGVALWELHMVEALRGTQDIPRMLVQYHDLLDDPVRTAQRLVERLCQSGVRGLAPPEESEVRAFVDADLRRQRATTEQLEDFLTRPQLALARALSDGSALEGGYLPEQSETGKETLRSHDATLLAEAKAKHLRGEVSERDRTIEGLQEELSRSRDTARARTDDLSSATHALEGLRESERAILDKLDAIHEAVSRLEQRVAGLEQAGEGGCE